METFEKTYSELAANKTKYDHLFVVCQNLLKNWPHRDNAGNIVFDEKQRSKEGKVVQDSTPESKPLTTPEVVDKTFEEMHLLDAILQKAKKVRTSPKEISHSGYQTKVKSQKAAEVYKQPIARAAKSLKIPSGNSSCSNPQRQKKSANKVVIRTTKHASSAAGRFAGSDRNRTVTPASEDANGVHRTNGCPDGHKAKETFEDSNDGPAFNIQKHGSKLAMPSRYHRVQQALSKLTGAAMQQCSSSGGHLFCKRLSSHNDCGSLEAASSLLAAEELCFIKQTFISLTPHELTVNERSSWEEVWRIKTKLEALTEHAYDVGNHGGIDLVPVEEGGSTCVPHKTFVYSCTAEWESLVTTEMELLLSKHELELMQFVNQNLLPLLPVAGCPTHMIQTIFELVGITKPIYVKLLGSEY